MIARAAPSISAIRPRTSRDRNQPVASASPMIAASAQSSARPSVRSKAARAATSRPTSSSSPCGRRSDSAEISVGRVRSVR